MKIGVISDTHRDLTRQGQAAERLLKEGARTLIHLGDNYADADALLDLRVPLLRVPGVHSAEYRSPEVDNRLLRTFNGVPVLITHTVSTNTYDLPTDLRPEEIVNTGRARMVLYGHTHAFHTLVNRGAVFVNPGACKHPDGRSSTATCALITLHPKTIEVRILPLAGPPLVEKRFELLTRRIVEVPVR